MKNNFILLLTVICLLFLHVGCSDSEPEPDLSEDRGTFVTEIAREFYMVQWSNAGDEILYTVLSSSQTGVYALDLNNGERRTLQNTSLSGRSAAYHITQSADGQVIYFFTNTPPDGEVKRLYAINIDGTDKRIVIDSDRIRRPVVVSPNHEMIAYNQLPPPSILDGISFGNSTLTIHDTTFVLNLRDQSKTLIGPNGSAIAFSPDSKKLWIKGYTKGEFRLIDLSNNISENFALTTLYNPIAYHPISEGLLVLAVKDYGDTIQYFIVDLVTGESRMVWEMPAIPDHAISWFHLVAVSQDLTKMAYWDDLIKRLLVVVDLNTGTETTVFTAAGDVGHLLPGWVAFSPDSKTIAYSFTDVNPEKIISVYKRDL